MTTACLVGATGLVGAHILSTLKGSNAVGQIYAFSRRELAQDAKLSPIVSKESSTWPDSYPAGAELFFSALGTTRAQAGGFENQCKIDYDFNLELAKAARAKGAKIYVLISSHGADDSSMFGYPKMKGQLEEAVKAIDFEHVVFVRPGLIVGKRDSYNSRALEYVLRQTATVFGAVSGNRLKDFWAQDCDVIAKAAVKAGLDCANGHQQDRVRVLGQSDIVRLGRTEWQESAAAAATATTTTATAT